MVVVPSDQKQQRCRLLHYGATADHGATAEHGGAGGNTAEMDKVTRACMKDAAVTKAARGMTAEVGTGG